MEEVACGSRERSELRTHADPGNEHFPAALEWQEDRRTDLQQEMYRWQAWT